MSRESNVAVSCGVGRRRSSDPVWLWLWCRPAAVALIGPLAWELPYATSVALKSKTKKRTNEKVVLNNIYVKSLLFLSEALHFLKLELQKIHQFSSAKKHHPSGLQVSIKILFLLKTWRQSKTDEIFLIH